MPEAVSDLLLIESHLDRIEILAHQSRDLDRPFRAEHAAERQLADRLVAGVDDVEVVEVADDLLLVVPHPVDGLAHRPDRGDDHHFALHQAPGGILGEGHALGQQALDGARHQTEDLGAWLLVQVLEELQSVVALQLPQQLRGGLRAEVGDDRIAQFRLQVGEDLGLQRFPDDAQQQLALVPVQRLQQVGGVGRMQRLDQALDLPDIAVGQRLPHGIDLRGRQSDGVFARLLAARRFLRALGGGGFGHRQLLGSCSHYRTRERFTSQAQANRFRLRRSRSSWLLPRARRFAVVPERPPQRRRRH